MKVIQVNVWQGRIARPLFELLEAEAPDVVLTQEIYSFPINIPLNSPWAQFSILAQLAEHANLAHTYFSPCISYPIFGHELNYGNAILSKYRLDDTSTHYTGGPGPQHYTEPVAFDHNTTRLFQHAVIDTGRTKLHLINHHGHWAPNPQGDAVSAERLQLVADYINQLDGPVLAGGDLNLAPNSPAIQQFIKSTGLRDNLAGTGVTTTLSPAHYVDELIQCDYLLTSPDLKVTRATVSDKIVSDHKAVILEIDC